MVWRYTYIPSIFYKGVLLILLYIYGHETSGRSPTFRNSIYNKTTLRITYQRGVFKAAVHLQISGRSTNTHNTRLPQYGPLVRFFGSGIQSLDCTTWFSLSGPRVLNNMPVQTMPKPLYHLSRLELYQESCPCTLYLPLIWVLGRAAYVQQDCATTRKKGDTSNDIDRSYHIHQHCFNL